MASDATPGDWTVDGFVRITDLQLSRKGLTLRGTRLPAAVYADKGFEFVKEGKGATVEIDALLDSGNVTFEQANAVLSKIFLTASDHLEEVVPDYWKPCFTRAFAGGQAGCRISPELLVVPGVSNLVAKSPEPMPGTLRGTKPPRVLQHQEPAFTEFARRVKVQGTVSLRLAVDATGVPNNIRIIVPVGCGLDEQARRTVAGWRFSPAERDGQPVTSEIAVEVNFHLY